MAHTPGPWFNKFEDMGGYDCMTHAINIYNDVPDKNKVLIAQLDLSSYGQIACEYDFNSVTAIDNARLISAAPELLEALRDAVESLKRLPTVDGAYRVTCISQGEKAIAKAEGRD